MNSAVFSHVLEVQTLEPDMLFNGVYTGKVTSLPLFEIPLFIGASAEFLAEHHNEKSLSIILHLTESSSLEHKIIPV